MPKQAGDWLLNLSAALESTRAKVSGAEVSGRKAMSDLERLLTEFRNANAGVWWVGNGGSSAICSHLSQDLLNKLQIRSQVLSDASLLTCIANDFGYEQIYVRPLGVLAQPGDLLIAISSSGRSMNILNAVELAQKKGMKTVTLSAFAENNPLWKMPADISFYLPSDLYGIVEIGHSAILHAVIECMVLQDISREEKVQ